MYFTKKVLAALLLAPSALVSAEIGLQSFICGPNTGGRPALRTHHWRGNEDYDNFKMCVRPIKYEINFYKVVGLRPEICDNDSGSLPMSEVSVVNDVDGAMSWGSVRGSTDSMGFTGIINESLISGTDFDFKCKGTATVRYIGPKEVQTYKFTIPQIEDVYAGLCVTNGSITSTTSSGYSWGTIDTFQAGEPMFTGSLDDPLIWTSTGGSCQGRPLKIPSSKLGAGTTVDVSTLADNRRNGVKICVVTNSGQNTAVEPYLLNDGFQADRYGFFGSYRTYCKTLKQPIEVIEEEDTTFTSTIELDTKVTMRLHL